MASFISKIRNCVCRDGHDLSMSLSFSDLLLNFSTTLSTSHFPFLTVAVDFNIPESLDPDTGIKT